MIMRVSQRPMPQRRPETPPLPMRMGGADGGAFNLFGSCRKGGIAVGAGKSAADDQLDLAAARSDCNDTVSEWQLYSC